MLYTKTVAFDSKAGKLAHSGYLSRSEKIQESNVIVDRLMELCAERRMVALLSIPLKFS